jgi:hypothetical protein
MTTNFQYVAPLPIIILSATLKLGKPVIFDSLQKELGKYCLAKGSPVWLRGFGWRNAERVEEMFLSPIAMEELYMRLLMLQAGNGHCGDFAILKATFVDTGKFEDFITALHDLHMLNNQPLLS